MTLDTTVNGETRRIRLEATGDGVTSCWGDQQQELVVRQVEPGVYHVVHQGRSVTVTLGEHGWAEADGRIFQVEITDPREAVAGRSAGGGAGQMKIAAPMPGKVIRVLVSEGESVTAGQGLVVVEAMKMQNEMKAPRDGIVVTLKAQEAATVAAGEVLMILE